MKLVSVSEAEQTNNNINIITTHMCNPQKKMN